MTSLTEPLVRNVSDTARWVATYRAIESARPDAIFRDPFAERLAGDRGWEILRALPRGEESAWAMIVRTAVFDEMVLGAIARGAGAVLNLAAGFDARPYRLALPADLPWLEADLPALLADKESLLAGERPACRLERIAVDLADRPARRALFARVGREHRDVFVLSEGLVTYLSPEQVAELAGDLAAVPSLRWWAVDFASPLLLRITRRLWGRQLAQAPFLFGPQEGARFFAPFGFAAAEIRYAVIEGERLGRPLPMGRFERLAWRLLPAPLRRPVRHMFRLALLERTPSS